MSDITGAIVHLNDTRRFYRVHTMGVRQASSIHRSDRGKKENLANGPVDCTDCQFASNRLESSRGRTMCQRSTIGTPNFAQHRRICESEALK